MFQLHSETSKAAFDNVDVDSQNNDVLAAFKTFGYQGATCEEVHLKLKAMYKHWSTKPYGTVSARMTNLKGRNIFWKNETRKTESGSDAEVWVHQEFATDKERLWTAEKPASKRQQISDIITSAQNFLVSMEKAKAVDGIWIKGMHHNIGQLQKAQDLLK